MSKRKFVYNIAGLALTVWNTTRLVRAMQEQSTEIAHKVTIEMAQQKLKARRHGADAVAGIARDVFTQLGQKAPADLDGPVYDINETMLRDALANVVDRALA